MDETAIGEVIDGMYAMISGPAGPRDWRRQADLFHPDCRQVRTGVDAEGVPWRRSFTLDEYRENADALLSAKGFFEVERGRRIDVFGNIAHAWSAYEARISPGDAEPERRGINSIQLFKGEDGRWKILSMLWDNERDGIRLPGTA